MTYKIGKTREKISRRKAVLYELQEKDLKDDLDKANEKRALVKSIINSHADIIPDYQNNQLTVKIYTQAYPRLNIAIENTIQLLNETQTKYPGTNLVLHYEIAT